VNDPAVHQHYFVDEAGDLTLFDKRGRVIVGEEGVSRCFVVGAALVRDPVGLAAALDGLRSELMRDPYFAQIPSMRPDAGKTARLFHAKDDVAEVRREVFRLLQGANVEVFAAFRRKRVLAEELRSHFDATGEKRGVDHVYDDLVTSIFTNRLHLGEHTHIVFARRGKADRNVALAGAIELAKAKFERKWRKGIDRPTSISSSTPSEVTCLQAIDYYLWALQRLLERGEARYFDYLAPAFRLVVDRDDTRRHGYGEFYTASANPLTLERMMPVT
jgi:hypothetical protein